MNKKYQHYTNQGLTKRLHDFASVLTDTDVEEPTSIEIKHVIKEMSDELKWRQKHLPNRMTYSEQIYWILQDTDFYRIKVVKDEIERNILLRNGGYSIKNPTEDDLRNAAHDILWKVARESEGGHVKRTIQSGNFKATREIWDGIPCLSLEYVVAGWEMDYDSVTSTNYDDDAKYLGPKHD